MLADLIEKNRSFRRFEEKSRLSSESLEKLIEFARLSPSSRNQQALKFKIVTEKDECERLFPFLFWAGYLKDWNGPEEGERPPAYIVIFGDTELGSSFSVDMGICAQSILLGAVEQGYGGCMIGSLKREGMKQEFSLPESLEILLVIALGKPVERVVIDKMHDGDIKYWRDDDGVHHVPKRDINELIAW